MDSGHAQGGAASFQGGGECPPPRPPLNETLIHDGKQISAP